MCRVLMRIKLRVGEGELVHQSVKFVPPNPTKRLSF
jgi:hypothetical protein